jgi:tRNA pseudouridine38-40 synthase
VRSQYFYLLEIAYLGYKYHGYAIQPQHKTIQGQLEKTIRYILGKERPFKTLGCSRTDARVSAKQFYTELFLDSVLEDEAQFVEDFKKNLPQDIHFISFKKVDSKFNVIADVDYKTYTYTFATGKAYNAFNAPYIMHFREDLNLEKMNEAVALFTGRHNFFLFQTGKVNGGEFEKTVDACSLKKLENFALPANCEQDIYQFSITSKGFIRYQIRMMMGFLVEIGRGERSIEELKLALQADSGVRKLCFVAPAHGLLLNKVIFKHG